MPHIGTHFDHVPLLCLPIDLKLRTIEHGLPENRE